MRLTLRTLLAWLDGVLPEDEQQQLGAKVSSSIVATQLVDRIRTAIGRTAIGAPRPDGRGLTEDPNSVAEYLDNTLSSEQLESFERICIESEVHLAEVAACHRLLAEVAREPAVEHGLHVDERQRIQQRLRGLLAGLHDRATTERDEAARRGDGHRESRETARAIREVMNAATPPGGDATPSGEGVARLDPKRAAPRPAERSSWVAWASAIVSLALLLALAGVLAWSLGGSLTGRRPSEVARGDGQRKGQGQGDKQNPVVPPAGPVPGVPAAEDATSVPAGADATPTVAKEEVPNNPVAVIAETAAEAIASEPEPEALSAAEDPAAEPSAALAVAVAEPPLAVGTSPESAATDADESPDQVGMVGGGGVLLRRTEGGEWTVFPAGSSLGKQEDLLVPRGSQPELHVRGVTIRLLPETRGVLTLDPDGVPRIQVVFGRALAQASLAEARLGITAAGLAGTVTAGLLSPVAVEVDLDRYPGADPTSTPPLTRSRIYAFQGLSWRQTTGGGLPVEQPLEGIDIEGLLAAGMSLEWISTASGRVAMVRNRGLPSWIESGSMPDRLEKSASEALAARVAATPPLMKALREMAVDKRAENRMLAASTLALLGEFDDLVEQLAAESPGKKLEGRQWMQLQTATIPLALARGENAALRLFESFASRGPRGKADMLRAMAVGFTDEGLAAGADRGLVEALEDPSLIVRRYAIKSLVDITQPSAVDRGRYRPDGLPDMRRDGVLWWRAQLEKGLIRRAPPAVGNTAPAAAETVPMPERE